MLNLELLGENILSVLAVLTIQMWKYGWPLQVRADSLIMTITILYHWVFFTCLWLFIYWIVLRQPLFTNASYAVNEGKFLKITCISRNVPDITTLQILNPYGVPVHADLGVFSVANVTRSYAGTYTCVVNSTLNNSESTVNTISVVIVNCKLSLYLQWHIQVLCL